MSLEHRSTRPTWRTVRRTIALVFVTAAAACGGSDKATAPKPASLTGTWRGTLADASSSSTVTLTMTSASNLVSGSGTIVAGTTSVALTSAGSVSDAGAFTLTLTATGFQPISYTGTVSGTTMTGAASGSGYSNTALTLTKQ